MSIGADPVCGACLSRPPLWNDAIAALAYRFPADFLTCRFKFSGNPACGDVLAAELAAAVASSGCARPDVIIPVPLHRARHVQRTFNQAELLAISLGERLNIPLNRNGLQRSRRTQAQSGLNAVERRKNLRGAFILNKVASAELKGQHVALVDDVCTTGETLAACTQTLRRGGASNISIWVACRAPPP